MSRFIDKLNQASQASPPIGFKATSASRPKSKMLLIAGLAQADSEDMADRVAGADAGLLHLPDLKSGSKAIEQVLQAVPDIPWGGWLRDVGQKDITKIVNAGCDFVVFPATGTALAMLQDNGIGRILEVETALGEGLLKAVDKLPVDAVLIGDEPEPFLTWHYLMYLQQSADLLTKPLLASIPSNTMATELQALWDAGVDGVVVEVEAGQPADRLREIRQVIDGLTLPLHGKRKKPAALVPYASSQTAAAEEPEEE